MDIKRIENETNKKIKYFKQIESTHIYAKKIQKEDCIIIAEEQAGGIGTQGRKWHTGANKNIAMTIIKHPKCKIDKLNGLTIQIAETIKNIIKQLYGYELQIKIPNDLILNKKKISGILTEVHTRGEKIEYLLISIGFNVNEENFNNEIKEIATSLKREYKKEFSREDIIIKIIQEINKIVEQL